MMLFMVIETFDRQRVPEIYRRLEERGRMLPDGVEYIDSWIDTGFNRCFQLMRCDDARLLQSWVANWHDLAHFEIIPVAPSKETAEIWKAQRLK